MIILGTIATERDYPHNLTEDVRITNGIIKFFVSLSQTEFRALKAAQREPASASREDYDAS
jgi:hypothetical protein